MAARPLRDDGDRCQKCCFYGIVAFVFLVFGYCTYGIATLPPPPRYSAAVAAVSGLDPATDLRGAPHALDPAFNLTLRIDATLSAKDEAPYCLDRGTSVKVSYLRVPLAVGRAPEPGEGTYAAAGQRRDLAVVARGRAVVVPGFMLDSLAEDLRRGEAVFEITLMSPSVGAGHWEQMTCWGMVGDDASLEAPCVYSSVDVPPPCPGTPGRPGCVPRPRKVLPDDDVPADDDGSPAPMHAAAGTPAEHKSWSIVSQ